MRAATRLALAACLCALLSSAPAFAGGPRVVILPVVVHSAAQDPGYVSSGLSEMLSARLEQIGQVDVVRPEAAPATTRLPDAVEAARAAGGDYVLFGSFTQFGDGASLDVHCAPVRSEGDGRSIFIQSGTMGEIIPKLDDLADKVSRYVRGERGEAVAARQAPAAGVSSEALDELMRRLEALERAVFPPVVGATGETAVPEEPEDVGAPES